MVTWLALPLLEDEDTPRAVTGREGAETPIPIAQTTATRRGAEPAPSPAVEGLGDEPTERDGPLAVAASNPIVSDSPPSNSPATMTGLPNRRDGDAAERAPATTLLDESRISCDFGAGNNTGLRFGELLTVGGGAQWQGGLLDYDFDSSEPGTALLRANPGVTGSPSGETKVQVATEGTRLFLSGFQQNRAFVVVTIFDELDNVGRHIAVMSRHELSFSYASQFLGTCE